MGASLVQEGQFGVHQLQDLGGIGAAGALALDINEAS
jgi:hypothetical protein